MRYVLTTRPTIYGPEPRITKEDYRDRFPQEVEVAAGSKEFIKAAFKLVFPKRNYYEYLS